MLSCTNTLNSSCSLRCAASFRSPTDAVGRDEDNLALSKRRAKAVYDYLILRGISPDRLTHRGYGETHPIAPNDTPEGRAQNRRTTRTPLR